MHHFSRSAEAAEREAGRPEVEGEKGRRHHAPPAVVSRCKRPLEWGGIQ